MIQEFIELAELIMGIGMGILLIGAFLSMFAKDGGDDDRYNGAGTLG